MKTKGSNFGPIFRLQVKKDLTPTRNRIYSRVYRRVLAQSGDVELARVKAREECDRLDL